MGKGFAYVLTMLFAAVAAFGQESRATIGGAVTDQAFNAFNTPEFGDPNTTATSSLFGIVPNTQANDPRAIQVALRLTF